MICRDGRPFRYRTRALALALPPPRPRALASKRHAALAMGPSLRAPPGLELEGYY